MNREKLLIRLTCEHAIVFSPANVFQKNSLTGKLGETVKKWDKRANRDERLIEK